MVRPNCLVRGLWPVYVALLIGCSNGASSSGSSSSTAPATTAQVTATVNTTQIGGAGLTVLSAQQASVPVKNGSFTTTVSTLGPQLLFVQDSSGQNRGLTLSLPSLNQASPSIMTTDATSTALALLFLSPGVLTSDNAQAQQILTALQQMNSFSPFLAFLQTNLPTRSLDDLIQDATYQSLLTACLTEWPGVAAALPPIPAASVSARAAFAVNPQVTPPPSGTFPQLAGVNITADSSTQTVANIPVTMRNYGWRYIKVFKLGYDSNGTVLSTTSLADQKGATKLSVGAFLTNTVTNPSLAPDTADFSNGVAKFQYWIVGPGLGSCPECPNLPAQAGLNLGIDTTLWIETLVDYIVLETLSVLTGVPLGAIGSQVIPMLQSSQGFQNSVITLLDPTSSPQAATSALVNGTLSIFTALVKSNILPSAGLSSLLGPLNTVMSGANMAVTMAWLGTMPHIAKVEITAPYDTLQFSAAQYSAKKTDSQVAITVTRTNGSADTLTVNYSVSDGTAIAGQDYLATSGTLTFVPPPQGALSQTFNIPLINDSANTTSRTAQLALTLPNPSTGGKLGTPSTATLTIGTTAVSIKLSSLSCTILDSSFSWAPKIRGIATGTASASAGSVFGISFSYLSPLGGPTTVITCDGSCANGTFTQDGSTNWTVTQVGTLETQYTGLPTGVYRMPDITILTPNGGGGGIGMGNLGAAGSVQCQ